jgi:hypothetical protein
MLITYPLDMGAYLYDIGRPMINLKLTQQKEDSVEVFYK